MIRALNCRQFLFDGDFRAQVHVLFMNTAKIEK